MRIVLATPLYPPEIGGPATYTYELAQKLSKEHTITIVAYADNATPVENVTLVAVSKKIFLPLRLGIYFFKLLHAAKAADVIYAQNAVAAGLPAVWVGKLLHKPVCLKFVGDEAWERATQAGLTSEMLDAFLSKPMPNFKSKLFFSIQKFVLNNASKIVPPSAFLKTIINTRYGVPAERIEVNYNAAEIPEVEAVEKKHHQLVTAVRLVAWKGVAGIVAAVERVRAKPEFSDINLVIAGDGPERESLKAQIAQLKNHEKSFQMVGRLPKAQTLALQAESEIQILNSTYEGLPHGVLESFAVHTPVIATNIGGTNEAVLHEKTGLLVSAESFMSNVNSLAQAIERLLLDKPLQEKLTMGGAALLKEKFSWEAHLDKLLAVFDSLVKNTSHDSKRA